MRLIVKLGTSTLTNLTYRLSMPRMVDLVRQMSTLWSDGHEIILVSSGAMAAGREMLGFPELPKAIPAKQMLAAVGQPRLMDCWGRLFEIYGIRVAQILLTRSDLSVRGRYLNARNTLAALFHQRVVPVVNENDTVATEEIRVGDNDNLSALVSNLVDADMLILLTDQDGLYSDDPRRNHEAKLIPVVDTLNIEPALWEAAGSSGKLGVGGMVSKLQAADLARRSGTTVVIARGDRPDVILEIVQGVRIGTWFMPLTTTMESFKRYILSGGNDGTLTVDKGAAKAMIKGGSLLPPGLSSVSGAFERGNTVRITDPFGMEIARGLVNYGSQDCKKILGRQSHEIETLLGYFYGDEIVHRSNLVLV